MNLINKINKQAKYCFKNYKHFSCEMCPVRMLAVSLTDKDPAKIRTCIYFITDKKFSHYFKDSAYNCKGAIKNSLILAKEISTNKI